MWGIKGWKKVKEKNKKLRITWSSIVYPNVYLQIYKSREIWKVVLLYIPIGGKTMNLSLNGINIYKRRFKTKSQALWYARCWMGFVTIKHGFVSSFDEEIIFEVSREHK